MFQCGLTRASKIFGTAFLIGISSIVSIIIVVWIYNVLRKSRYLLFALSFILAGALGNLWDRLTLGYVVDFIEVHYQDL